MEQYTEHTIDSFYPKEVQMPASLIATPEKTKETTQKDGKQ
jgi:hypothetical protein